MAAVRRVAMAAVLVGLFCVQLDARPVLSHHSRFVRRESEVSTTTPATKAAQGVTAGAPSAADDGDDELLKAIEEKIMEKVMKNLEEKKVQEGGASSSGGAESSPVPTSGYRAGHTRHHSHHHHDDRAQLPLVREKHIRGEGEDDPWRDEELTGYRHRGAGSRAPDSEWPKPTSADESGCERPTRVQEQPDYFVTHGGRKVSLVGAEELGEESEGYPLEGLTRLDKGNNRRRALQVDFDTPHLLTAISFTKVLKHGSDRFAVAWRALDSAHWHFVKKAADPHMVKVFSYEQGAKFALTERVQSVRLYPEDWEEKARLPRPVFYECSPQTSSDLDSGEPAELEPDK